MSEKDYAPLSAACVRALNDKIYEKRKQAAVEIEKMVKEFHSSGSTTQITKLLKVLGQDFCTSPNAHARKGGLIGLAAIAIALGKDTSLYINELVQPILACFSDIDLRVRYFACESLYNVVKVARGSVLPQFTDIFSALSKLATDPEQSVKNASELLDRLLKDIVTESMSFDLVKFMPLLRERIYTRNSFARQFIISWVSVLDAVPDIDLVLFLPEILDGLFRMLDDSMVEIKKMCETVLGEFLRSIKADPSRADFPQLTNTLILHAQHSDELMQFTALTWIKEFVQLSGPCMLPFLSGIFTAMLPCLAYESDSQRSIPFVMNNIKETATALNLSLMRLVAIEVGEKDVVAVTKDIPTEGVDLPSSGLDLASVINVLVSNLGNKSTLVATKVAVLEWIHHLYMQIPVKMEAHTEVLFPSLLAVLSDKSDEVVLQGLVVLAEGVAKGSPQPCNKVTTKSEQGTHYTKFLISLLKLFSSDKKLLDNRGSFIIRQLCVLLSAEDIYRSFSKILILEPDLRFTSTMVETLNMILLTSSELFELRKKLKDLVTDDSVSLFICLYECWAHNPVATIALCLLSQNYQHVSDLVKLFGSLEVTVELLTEIDKLVQLIESPIFAFLRLELLSCSRGAPLLVALYGLLMLLPQSEAFNTLRARLDCIPAMHICCKATPEKPLQIPRIDDKKLLEQFIKVQDTHKTYKAQLRAQALSMMQTDLAGFDTKSEKLS